MTDKKTSRRKLLKSIVAGTGAVAAGQSLPNSWTKPVVDSVLLPAHAATTGVEPLPTDYSGEFTFSETSGSNSLIQDVLSVVVQDAHAGFSIPGGEMCIKVEAPAGPGASYTATVLFVAGDEFDGVYMASGTVGGGPAPVAWENGCNVASAVTLDVSAVSAAGANYFFQAVDGPVSAGVLPEGTDCPTVTKCT